MLPATRWRARTTPYESCAPLRRCCAFWGCIRIARLSARRPPLTAESECARRDSNPRPSAPEAPTASDHQRWPLSFQALTRVARRPAPASDGPVVTTVVTAGRFSVAVLEQRPPVRASGGRYPQITPVDLPEQDPRRLQPPGINT